MTLNNLQNLISESIKKVLNESSKRTIINRFYKMVHPLTQSRFHDKAWENVHHVFDAIGEWADDINVWVEDGGYGRSRDGMSEYKDWQFKVLKDNVTLTGYLRAHACGSNEDIWDTYDVSIIVW